MAVPEVVTRYFQADARRDIDAVVALFADDAVVVDEGETWRGIDEIRAWRHGPASPPARRMGTRQWFGA